MRKESIKSSNALPEKKFQIQNGSSAEARQMPRKESAASRRFFRAYLLSTIRKYNKESSFSAFSIAKMAMAFITLLALSGIFYSQQSSQTYLTDSRTPASMANGAAAGSYALSDIESVNLLSGGLSINLPLVQIGGRGNAGYTMSLPFDGNNWRIQDSYYPSGTWGGGPPPPSAWAHHFHPQLGRWSLGAGFGPGKMESRRTSTFEGVCPATNGISVNGGDVLTRLTFSMPGGGEMEFFDKRTGGAKAHYGFNSCSQTPDAANRGNVWVTGDGSNVVFITAGNFTESPGSGTFVGVATGDMYFPDGTHYRIDGGNVIYINDRNGNKVSFTYTSGALTSISDSLNRLTTISYGSPTIITFSGFGGISRTIEIGNDLHSNLLQTGYTMKSSRDLFPTLGTDASTVISDVSRVSYVKLPDGRQYNFKYNSYGDIARVELPTGGAFEYDWGGSNSTVGDCIAMIRRWVNERRVYPEGGTGTGYALKTNYQYSYDSIDGSSVKRTTVVTSKKDGGGDTNLNFTKHYFTPDGGTCEGFEMSMGSFGKELQTETYTADGNNLLRKVKTDFSGRLMSTVTGTVAIDTRPVRTTVTLADVMPNLISKQEYGYDSADVSRQTDVWEYAYGSGQVGTTLLRRSHTDFLSINPVNNANYLDNSIHLVNLPVLSWVSSDAAGGNKLSLTKYEYDNYGSDAFHAQLTARDDISGHRRSDPQNSFDTGYATRGNLTRTIIYKTPNSPDEAQIVSAASHYDIAGNVVKVFNARGFFSTIEYADRFGSPDGEARSNNPPAQLSGKQTYAYATKSINPKLFTNFVQREYFTGVVINSEDVNGVIGKTLYNDALNRPTQSVTAVGTALEQQSSILYDELNHRILKTSDFNALNDNALKIEEFYDGMGRTTESRRYEADGTYTATRARYDAAGRIVQTSNPFKQNTAENDLRWTKNQYDALGRMSKVIYPDDTPNTDADNSVVVNTYAGNTKTVIDQAGRKRAGISDALGRTTQVIEDPDGQNLPTSYVFDALGNIRRTVQGVQNRYFLYDALGRVIRVRQPEQGTNASFNVTDPLTGNSQWSVSYSYDDNGNIDNTTDARGVSVTGTYDELDRLTFRNYSDSTSDVTFTYDMTNIQGTALNYKGGLTKIVTGNPLNPFSVTDNLATDTLGRVKTSRQTTDGNIYNFPNYSYNLAGALMSQTYPSGKVISSEYQTDGDLSRVTGQANINSGAKLYASAFSYTADGTVKAMRLGNGKWESAQFNARLQTTQISLGTAETDTSLLKLELNYGTNNLNNSSVREQKISFNGLAQPIIQTYDYDSLNRLKSATETNQGSATTVWQETFDYDRYGNRSFDELNTTTITRGCATNAQNPNGVCNKAVVNPRYKADNRFDDGQIYEYDPAGNLTKDAEGKSFAYDAENHQKSFGTNGSNTNGGQYFYDGQGKRVKTSIPLLQSGNIETIFVYDALGKLVEEYENAPPVAAPKTSYLTADHLGTPRIVTDGLGEIVSRHDYRAFGEEVYAGVGSRTTGGKYSVVDDVRQQYTGYERDAESGLDYAQARYYNSRHGRFTSVDPLTASATIRNPQTFNRYSYALNSPYKFTDPLGLYSDCGTRPDICEDTTHLKEITEKERQKSQQQPQGSETATANVTEVPASCMIGCRPVPTGETVTVSVTQTTQPKLTSGPFLPGGLPAVAAGVFTNISFTDGNGNPVQGTLGESVEALEGEPITQTSGQHPFNGTQPDLVSNARAAPTSFADEGRLQRELNADFTSRQLQTLTLQSNTGLEITATQERTITNANPSAPSLDGGRVRGYTFSMEKPQIRITPRYTGQY